MKTVLAILLFLAGAIPSAWAGLSRAQLATVSATPPPGAHLDLGLAARDAHGSVRRIGEILSGRPAFVNFVDYTCNTLCGTDLQLLSQALQSSHLDASRYRIVVIGLDPKDKPQDARAMAAKEIPSALLRNTVLLLPDKTFVRRTTQALGFHYVYDPAIDQFAHPAVVYVIDAHGGLRATLSPFALTTADLAAALQGPASAGGLLRRVHLLCYAYDPATGIYSLRIVRLMKAAGTLTVLALGAALIVLARKGRRAS